jgi:voltage-gated potassium channel Kch
MGAVGVVASVALILLIFVDSFETTVLPRRVTHRYRFARLFYLSTWKIWRIVALRIPVGKWRESFLSLFGPLSLLGLLLTWVVGLIFGFAVLHWSLGVAVHSPEQEPTFGTHLYWSGVTFFTLGYGDVTPVTPFGRALAVVEAGTGFGFLAVIIGYLPVIYQVFSHREVAIALLDARAGSPPSAAQMLIRQARSGDVASIDPFLAEWERWSAELLESHLSFPVLAYYRSQHDNQSWLSALTAVLDTCAFLIVAVKGRNPYQAQLTFAMARHAAVDLALVFRTPPVLPGPERLSRAQLQQLREQLREAGLSLQEGPTVDARLAELRGMYEPFVNALARRFLFALPAFVPDGPNPDNWQRSAWLKRAPEIGNLPIVSTGDDHFE